MRRILVVVAVLGAVAVPGQAAAGVRVTTTQFNPTPGLDRIDQRQLPLSSSYSFTTDGRGVRVYTFDGARIDHSDFSGRAQYGEDCVDWDGIAEDTGSGTHSAATAVGVRYGSAKAADLRVYRTASAESLTACLGLVAQEAELPAVALITSVYPSSADLDNAVRALIAVGVTVVVAAGDDNANASNFSPSKVAEAIVAYGARSTGDLFLPGSNYGTSIDVAAVGESVESAHSRTTSTFRTGTAPAAGYVAGVAARYLQTHPDAAPAEVHRAVVDAATPTTGIVRMLHWPEGQ